MRTAFLRCARAALDVVAPPTCLSCDEPGQGPLGLCPRCVRLLRPAPPAPCRRCAAALGPGADPTSCRDCARLGPRFTAAVSAGPYAGFLGELVRRAKYGKDALLAWPLEGLVGDAVERWPGREGIDVVVPVPTTDARRRERGFHLAEQLAAAAADRLGADLATNWLLRPGDPVPQAALSRTERRKAARGTVALHRRRWLPDPARRVAGLRVLLVDDVLTTGATANECARVLIEAGAAEVRVAVAARA